jgi:hypothetical protein
VPEISGKPVALTTGREHERRATHAHHPARARARARLGARLRCKIACLEASGGAIAIAIAIVFAIACAFASAFASASAVRDHALDALRAGASAQLDARTPRRAEQRLDHGATVVGRREDTPVGLDLQPDVVEAATLCGGGCNPISTCQ